MRAFAIRHVGWCGYGGWVFMYEFFVAFEHLSINTKMKLLSKRRRRRDILDKAWTKMHVHINNSSSCNKQALVPYHLATPKDCQGGDFCDMVWRVYDRWPHHLMALYLYFIWFKSLVVPLIFHMHAWIYSFSRCHSQIQSIHWSHVKHANQLGGVQ